jgi:hypothetical protein
MMPNRPYCSAAVSGLSFSFFLSLLLRFLSLPLLRRLESLLLRFLPDLDLLLRRLESLLRRFCRRTCHNKVSEGQGVAGQS